MSIYIYLDNLCIDPLLDKNSNLLRWYFVGVSSEINLLINVHTGNYKEHSRPPGSSSQQSAQSEDDCPLILLDNLVIRSTVSFSDLSIKESDLDNKEEGEWEEEDNQEDREEGEQSGAQAWTILAIWKIQSIKK